MEGQFKLGKLFYQSISN